MRKITLLFALLCSLYLAAEPQNGVVYVVPGGAGSGASWSDALGDIQAAINLAKSENPDARKDVWVATGEFTISTCISIVDSVNVYGSFAGTESSVSERAKVAGGEAWDFVNPTVLKGDNSRLIQVSAAADQETVVDGFILTGGNGKGSVTDTNGGAVLLRPNVAVQNSIIKNSTATGAGGGVMMNAGGIVRYCLIKDNTQTTNANGGGGVFCNTSTSGGTGYIEHCEITGNSSTIRGGGMVVQGSTYTYVSNCKIYNNMAVDGTTLKPGGAIYTNSANNVIQNSLVYNNTGANAIYFNGGALYNNVIVKNIGGLYTAGNSIKLINNVVWACVTDAAATVATSISGAANAAALVHNNATYNPVPSDKNWDIAGNIQLSSNVSNGDVPEAAPGTAGSGPEFAKVSSFFGTGITEAELANLDSVNWIPNASSPLVNAGEAIASVIEDYAGLFRPQGFPAEEARYDIGAYELPYYPVVAGEGEGGNGYIYSSLGIVLDKDFTYGYAKGSKLELFFEPKAGYEIGRAYYTISNDGGLTFTGEEVDFKDEIDRDGFWTVTVNNSFKVTVDWHSFTAFPQLDSGKIVCFGNENGIRITGVKAGQDIRVYNMTGACVSHLKAGSGNIFLPARPGLYIVHLAEDVRKIVIK